MCRRPSSSASCFASVVLPTPGVPVMRMLGRFGVHEDGVSSEAGPEVAPGAILKGERG